MSPITANYIEYKYRCLECQMMLKELQEQLEQQMAHDGQESADEDFYAGYIDYINMNMLESILRKMPRLTTLKYAQG